MVRMARDDKFKQYQTVGSEFVDAARAQVEDFVRELFHAGQTTSKQASEQVDDIVDLGRRSTEQLFGTIRSEIAQQLGQLGLATKTDLRDLERRVTGPVPSGAARKTTVRKTAAKKTAVRKSAGRKTAGTKAAATKTIAANKAGGTKKVTAKKATPAKNTAKKAAASKASVTTKKASPRR